MSYQQNSGYGNSPYQSGPGAESGYGASNEMSGYGRPYEEQGQYNQQPGYAAQPSVLSQQDFLERIRFAKSEINSLTTHVHEISTLHQKALSSTDSSLSGQLEALVTQTQLKNTQIRDQIKYLEADALKTTDGTKNVKTTQVKALKKEFERELKGYQQEELSYQQRYRDQIARQYRIVNPDATEEEVQQATEMDWGQEGVFQTALKSNRLGQANSVLGAVRARHNELQRIEKTLVELAALFNEMAQAVEIQDEQIKATEQSALDTNEHMAQANVQIDKGIEHARRRNRLKWYCLLVTVLIIIAIALGVGLGYGLTHANSSSNNSNN